LGEGDIGMALTTMRLGQTVFGAPVAFGLKSSRQFGTTPRACRFGHAVFGAPIAGRRFSAPAEIMTIVRLQSRTGMFRVTVGVLLTGAVAPATLKQIPDRYSQDQK